MFRRILVPVDGSMTSRRGLRLAIELARDQKAALELLHVIDILLVTPALSGGTYVSTQQVGEFVTALRKQGKKVLAQAESLVMKGGIKCHAETVETPGSRVADSIVAHARKRRVDLIVIGTHGRRGLSRMVLGSDAEGVVRESPVPVLLVRLAKAPTARRKSKRPARKRAAAPRTRQG